MKKSYNKGEDNHFNTHGKSSTKLYKKWEDLKSRCLNKNNRNFHNYGGRGITVCIEWLKDYMNFYNWAVLNGYTEGLQIDRINNDGNYEPNNCRFITHAENNRNKQATILNWDKVTTIRQLKRDTSISNIELSNIFKVSRPTISSIIHNRTWRKE